MSRNFVGQVVASEGQLYDIEIEQQQQQQQPYLELPQTQLDNKIYNILGFKFPANILLQRNKNPLIYLYIVLISNFIWPVIFLISYILPFQTFLVSAWKLVILLPGVGVVIFGIFSTIFFLQVPDFNNNCNSNDGNENQNQNNNNNNNFQLKIIKLQKKQRIFMILTLFSLLVLLFFSLFLQYKSLCVGKICLPYIVNIFISVFFLAFTWVLSLQKNQILSNEKFYQLKFFVQRILLGFIVANVVLDIYSDFALCILNFIFQTFTIDRSQNLAIYYWTLALAIFGMIDFVLLVLSVRFRVYSFILLNKIVLCVVIVNVLINLTEVPLFVGQFCLITTGISFSYYYCCYFEFVDCLRRCRSRTRNVDQNSPEQHI